MGPKKENTTPRLKADAAFRKDFVTICLEEVNSEGYCGSSLKQCSWNRLIEELSEKYKTKYIQRQLKNQWDYLRKLYAAWRYLEKRTEHGYDAEAGTFHWPDHVWEEIIKKYPMTAQFRYTPLEHRDLLQSLFECTLTKGDDCSPQKHKLPRENPSNRPALEDDDDADVFREDGPFASQDASQTVYDSQDAPQPELEDVSHTPAPGQVGQCILPLRSVPPQSAPSCTAPPSQTAPSHSTPPSQCAPLSQSDASSSRSAGSRRKRASVEDPLVKKLDDLMGLIKRQHVSGVHTLDQAIEVLNELLSLRLLEIDLYLASLKAFADNPLYSKMFLKIESNELKVRFLATIV